MANTASHLSGSLNGSSATLDPAFIQFSPQWHIVTNLGVHLATYDSDSRLIPSAAKSWTIDNDFKVYRFVLREDVKDSKGTVLTSDDWRATLEHLLDSNGSTHSFISDILGKKGILTPAPFILELHLNKPYKTLLQRLTSPEFILLPKTSIGLKSVDFSNSSGPYFVQDSNLQNQSVKLSANKNYFNYSSEQPETVQIVNLKGGSYELANAVREHVLNFALLSLFPTDANIEKIQNYIKNKEINSESVEPSNVALMVYSSHSKINTGSRLALLDLFESEGKSAFVSSNSKPALQFFPPHLHGSLSSSEENALMKDVKSKSSGLPKELSIYCSVAVASKGLNTWVEGVLKKHGIKYTLKIIESADYRKNRMSLDHDIYIMSTGVNSKDPAGSLLDMIDSKGGLIYDPDHKLVSLLKIAALGSSDDSAKALHELSVEMIIGGRIIPLFHYGTTIISSKDIVARPPTLFDDELELHTIRWKK